MLCLYNLLPVNRGELKFRLTFEIDENLILTASVMQIDSIGKPAIPTKQHTLKCDISGIRFEEESAE